MPKREWNKVTKRQIELRIVHSTERRRRREKKKQHTTNESSHCKEKKRLKKMSFVKWLNGRKLAYCVYFHRRNEHDTILIEEREMKKMSE